MFREYDHEKSRHRLQLRHASRTYTPPINVNIDTSEYVVDYTSKLTRRKARDRYHTQAMREFRVRGEVFTFLAPIYYGQFKIAKSKFWNNIVTIRDFIENEMDDPELHLLEYDWRLHNLGKTPIRMGINRAGSVKHKRHSNPPAEFETILPNTYDYSCRPYERLKQGDRIAIQTFKGHTQLELILTKTPSHMTIIKNHRQADALRKGTKKQLNEYLSDLELGLE